MVGSTPVNLLFAAVSPAALVSKALLSCLGTSGAERPPGAFVSKEPVCTVVVGRQDH